MITDSILWLVIGVTVALIAVSIVAIAWHGMRKKKKSSPGPTPTPVATTPPEESTSTATARKTEVRWWSGKKLFGWKSLLTVLLVLVIALIIYALLVWVAQLELPRPRTFSWGTVPDIVISDAVKKWLAAILVISAFLALLYVLPWKGRLVALAILAVIILGKNGGFQGNGTLPTAGAPEVATFLAARSNCDGQVRQGVLVTPAGRKVNDSCSFTFEVTSGCMYFDGPHGRTQTWCEGTRPMKGQQPKQVMRAIAITPEAKLDYVLCPRGSPMNGWSCT